MADCFFGTDEVRIDAKGRVSVPIAIRDELARSELKGMVVYPHVPAEDTDPVEGPHYVGCSYERANRYAKAVDSFGPSSRESRIVGIGLLTSFRRLQFDAEGRVVLPRELIEHCQLKPGRRVCFAGRGPTFDIWDPDLFAEEYENVRSQLPEYQDRLNRIWAGSSGGSES